LHDNALEPTSSDLHDRYSHAPKRGLRQVAKLCLASRYERKIVDEVLLSRAKEAEERLLEAEQDVVVARVEFHRAVRRLHLSGASLRELADALQFSHQRVHQGAGGARRWRSRDRMPRELNCSFCGRSQHMARKVVAGPGGVRGARRVSHRLGANKETALGTIEPLPANAIARRCSFCGKHRHQVTGLATTVDNPAGKLNADAATCSECLALCREIHVEESAQTGPASEVAG
jgi:hypothetical protein